MFCKKRITALLLSVVLVLSINIPVVAQVDISADSAILIEASTGKVIFEKDATARKSPASITKIMTLLLIFDQIKAGKITLEEMKRMIDSI